MGYELKHYYRVKLALVLARQGFLKEPPKDDFSSQTSPFLVIYKNLSNPFRFIHLLTEGRKHDIIITTNDIKGTS